jgi:predicted metal-dependent phosphoesterase TrpH
MNAFELHCHSHYSRGKKLPGEVFHSPREMVRQARKAGLTGIALTDHGVNTGWEEAREEARRQGIIFIPGIELYTDRGHLIGLGLNEFIPSYLPLGEALERIREQGALSVAPHPFDIRADGIGNSFVRADAVEVFNSMNIDRFSNIMAKSRALKAGKPMVVGSDAHMLEAIGLCRNYIRADNADSVLNEIRKGRVGYRTSYISRDALARWSRERFSNSYNQVLSYIERNYNPLKAWLSRRLMHRFVYCESTACRSLWYTLGQVGMALSRPYGAVYMLRYF